MRPGVDSDRSGAKTRRIGNRFAGCPLQVRQSRETAVSRVAIGVELKRRGNFERRFARVPGFGPTAARTSSKWRR